jgi:hypothetical protein
MLSDKTIWILIFGFLTTNCAVIKDNSARQVVPLERTDYEKLNGQFSNYPTSSDGIISRDMISKDYKSLTLWSQIVGFNETGSKETFENQVVVLTFISDKRAKAELWENGQLKRSKKIHGEIKDGYFYRRPYFIAIPLVPLLVGYKTYRYRIGLSDNSIVVDYKWNTWGFMVVAGNYSAGQSSSTFNKK